MINLKSAELIIGCFSFFIAYIISVTLSGFFCAWAAKVAGDDTRERCGFLTLNPAVHVDVIGMICLFLMSFGWGRKLPINPFNIHAPYKYLKLLFAYLADSIAQLFLATVALFIIIFGFGLKALFVSIPMMLSGVLSFPSFVAMFPELPSLLIVAMLILIFSIYLNLMLAVLYLIFNLFNFFFHIFTKDSYSSTNFAYLIYGSKNLVYLVVIPILLMMFFAPPLRQLIFYCIAQAGYYLACLCGVG